MRESGMYWVLWHEAEWDAEWDIKGAWFCLGTEQAFSDEYFEIGPRAVYPG